MSKTDLAKDIADLLREYMDYADKSVPGLEWKKYQGVGDEIVGVSASITGDQAEELDQFNREIYTHDTITVEGYVGENIAFNVMDSEDDQELGAIVMNFLSVPLDEDTLV